MITVPTLRSSDAHQSVTLFDLMSDSRRRYVVSALAGRESPVSLSALAEAVAKREGETDRAPAAATDEVSVSLHHLHLPKLSHAGVVDYDPEEEIVRPVRAAELARDLAGVEEEVEHRQ